MKNDIAKRYNIYKLYLIENDQNSKFLFFGDFSLYKEK